jgi:hypothetical protein
MPVLESKLIIGASDETAAAFASVMARIEALQVKVAEVQTKTAAVSGASVAAEKSPLARRGDFSTAVEHSTGSLFKMVAAAEAAEIAFKALAGGVNQSLDQQHEKVRAQASGMTPEEVASDEKLSHELAAKYPAIPEAEHMNVLRNIRSIVGSYSGAAELADEVAQLRVVAMGANVKSSPEELSEEFDQLVKGIEIKGATQDPKEFHQYMEGIAKGLNAFGDTLKPVEYYQMFKYGRQATPMLSDQFMLETAPELAQELKGSSYGRAVSAFNRAIVAGHDPHDTFRALNEWGLLKEENLDRTKTGEIKGLKPGAHIEGWETAQTNPNTWVREYLLPALSAHGITDKQDVSAAIGRVFENQMAAQMVSILATQQQRIDKSRNILRGAQGLESAPDFARQDPHIASEALRNSISNTIASAVPAGLIANIESGLATGLMRRGGHTLPDMIRDIGGYAPSFPVFNPTVQLPAGAAHIPVGRDPRSPSTGPDAYFPPNAPPAFKGASDWEAKAKGLTLAPQAPQAQPQQPQGPQAVNVSGEAQVQHEITVRIEPSPLLTAIVDQARQNSQTLVPLIGGGSGAMDSDAAPHRAGGIGSR